MLTRWKMNKNLLNMNKAIVLKVGCCNSCGSFTINYAISNL